MKINKIAEIQTSNIIPIITDMKNSVFEELVDINSGFDGFIETFKYKDWLYYTVKISPPKIDSIDSIDSIEDLENTKNID